MSIDRSDAANADRFVTRVGAGVRYVTTWKKWIIWDGKRWGIDEGERITGLALASSRLTYDEANKRNLKAAEVAACAVEGGEPLARKPLQEAARDVTFAILSRNAQRLRAVIELARADERVAIRHEALDADPLLLTVENGTIDLRTGRLREARPTDLITKLAPVTYDAAAKCPTWDAFLDRCMGGQEALVGYLRRLTGYSLTGSVEEHVLTFHHGNGANGKSTFFGAIERMLGDYAGTAARHLLFRSRGDRHPTEIAALHGKRFVSCSEIEEGHAFDESLVKDLTGGDLVTARRMREDFWSFAPTHKLWLMGNYLPVVRGDDKGIWRRLRLIPWSVDIPEDERDRELPGKLDAERLGILNWALRGLAEWRAEGLYEPTVVRDATHRYRSENDQVGRFCDECLTFAEGALITRAQLRALYEAHCAELGVERPIGPRRLAARLRERGARETTMRTGTTVTHGWKGLRPATSDEIRLQGKLRLVQGKDPA